MLWLSVLYLASLCAIQTALVDPALHGMEFVWPLFWLALEANVVLGVAVL